MPAVPKLQPAHLTAVCDLLGESAGGLTGSEIGGLLRQCGVEDREPPMTKRHRLFEALERRQNGDGCANHVVAFIQAAMDPVSYISNGQLFEQRRERLNAALAFCGLTLEEDGKLRQVAAVRTLSEATERAGRLRAELERRRVHHDVLRFCRAELLQDNYFHAVLEATKSVAQKIRDLTGLTSDGAALVDEAFGRSGGTPLLAFNTLQTETEQSEHTGLMNIMKGMFGAFRNPTAHGPKISRPVPEEDALDLLALASMLHRRLDRAVKTQ